MENKIEASTLESRKPQILAKFSEYITKEAPEKAKKKNAKFLAQILKSSAEQLSFGESPTYEIGYVYGNVTAEGSRDVGGTTYTHTFTIDLQTPEYGFFEMSNNDPHKDVFKRACMRLGLNHYVYSVKKSLNSPKQISKVYVTCYEDEALHDYAMGICEEQLARLNCYTDECRVNDYDFVETQETKESNIYPVYLALKDKKGKEYNVLIGYYNAATDETYFEFDFGLTTASDVLLTILGIAFLAPPAIGILVGIIMFIAFLIQYFA